MEGSFNAPERGGKSLYPFTLILKTALNSRRTPDTTERVRRMHDDLMHAYGPQDWWPAKTPFEVILGAYLTQNTAWKAVERSLVNLRAAGALSVKG
jgi:hypothetical protein